MANIKAKPPFKNKSFHENADSFAFVESWVAASLPFKRYNFWFLN